MIVQELRRIQERFGWLPPERLRKLSDKLKVPLHRLHEVASFYPLYKLTEPKAVEIKVCRDMACHIAGAPDLKMRLEAAFGNDIASGKCAIDGVSCLGQCDRPIAVSVNDHHIYRGWNEHELRNAIVTALNRGDMPHQHAGTETLGWKIDVYRGKPSYAAVETFFKWGADHRAADEIIKRLQDSTLKGLGGAGFPTWRKWDTVRKTPDPTKYVICNADESEPGTFKDRELLRRTPWLVIEGMVLAALITGAEKGYIYLRHEYPEEEHAIAHALKEAKEIFGVIGDNIRNSGRKFDLELYISPGGYVQGEESSLLEAIEDKRGEPRNKPPFPVYQGLFGKPTIINNVETLSWVPGIILNGGDWYGKGGVNGAAGMRFISISGDVQRPGVYEAPFGMTVGELVMGLAGGMSGNQKLKAIAPSGPSGGFLPAILKKDQMPAKFVTEKMKGADTYDVLNLPMDNATLSLAGSMLGAAFVVYGSNRDMVDQALNCTEFYRNESCGKCVPCRTGSQKLVDMFTALMRGDRKQKEHVSLPLASELADVMILTSICGLGQVASNPITTVIKFFKNEVEAYLAGVGQDPRRPQRTMLKTLDRPMEPPKLA